MPMTHILVFLATGLLLAPAAGCASRQRPASFPANSAASPKAKVAAPAKLTRAFEDDLASAESAAPSQHSSENPSPAEKESHHGHHHH